MTSLKIQIPKGTSETTRPGSPRRLFTTKHDEERIRLASEDRKAKLESRALRRLDEAAGTLFYEGLERAEGDFKLKELFLTELAREENALQGLSRVDSTSCELRNETEIEQKLRRLKFETMGALKQFYF
jgi:hypothetical protein